MAYHVRNKNALKMFEAMDARGIEENLLAAKACISSETLRRLRMGDNQTVNRSTLKKINAVLVAEGHDIRFTRRGNSRVIDVRQAATKAGPMPAIVEEKIEVPAPKKRYVAVPPNKNKTVLLNQCRAAFEAARAIPDDATPEQIDFIRPVISRMISGEAVKTA